MNITGVQRIKLLECLHSMFCKRGEIFSLDWGQNVLQSKACVQTQIGRCLEDIGKPKDKVAESSALVHENMKQEGQMTENKGLRT